MLSLLSIGAAVAGGVMLGVWWLSRRHDNFSYVDVAWGANFVLLAVLYFVLGEGDFERRLLICSMHALAGTRLACHLWQRIAGKPEEGRYQELRQRWGGNGQLARNFLIFFEAQAVLGVIFSVPMAIAATNPSTTIDLIEWLAVALWSVGFVGEGLADRQLARFKADPGNRGKVCDRGLWAFSRHPNYFFEWLMWVAYALFAWASPYGWVAIAMPLLMLHLLINVTGVKPTEAQSLRSRGEAYRAYQRRVSPFVPWFPKSEVAS